MSSEKNLAIQKLTKFISDCLIHEKRIFAAREKIKDIMPLGVESYQTLAETTIEHVDQLFYRFAKLQDTMGQNLLPAVLTALHEDTTKMSALDIVKRSETLGIIHRADEWVDMRILRTGMFDDRENDSAEMAVLLNRIYENSEKLSAVLHQIIAYAVKHLSLPF